LATHDSTVRSPDKRSSKRKQTDEALRESEEKHRRLFETMTQGVVYQAANGAIVSANPAAERILGLSLDQMMGRTFSDPGWEATREDGSDFPGNEHPAMVALRTGEPVYGVTMQVRDSAESKRRWITADAIPQFLPGETAPSSVYTTFADVTERKRADSSLRRAQFSIDNVPDCIVWIDHDGRYVDVNQTTCARLGYSHDELLTLSVFDLTVGLSPEGWPDRWRELKEHGPLTFEKQYRTKSGEIFPAEISSHILEYEGREHLLGIFRDITERKKQEELLQDEVSRRRLLVEQSRDGIVVLDQDGNVHEANEAYARMLGYSVEEVYQLRVWDWERQFSREQTLEMLNAVDEKGDLFETRHRRKDGTLRDVEISTNGAAYGGKKLIFCVVRDITERKQAEKALRLTQFSVDRAADSVFWADPQGHLVLVNDSACRLFGYSEEELLAMNVLDLDPSASAELQSANWERMKKEGTFTFETTCRTKSGDIRPVEVTVNYLQFDGTEYNCVFARDITERKQMEESLRRTQFVVDSSQDSIHWVDPEGRLLYANDACCRRLGYSREELLGMTVNDIDPLAPRPWSSHFQEIGDRGSFVFESLHRTKDGEIFPVEVTVNYVGYEEHEYSCASARDITERKAAEEALRQSEERLRESQKMEAVGQLAGGIAHDFNNLLTAILGYSEMILASGASSLEEIRPDLEEIKHAGQRASALTQQILAFSRRQILRPAALSLNEVVEGMESLLSRTLGEDINLITIEHPGLGLTEVDRHQFEQVLLNLALNARDAMPCGGRLTLETANVEVDEEYSRTHPQMAPGSYVMLLVSDTGVGMDPDTIDHAFEPFFTTKAFGAGTGLGLAVIHGIVTQSHGSISVCSEPGQGATFKIYLPRAVPSDTSEELIIPPRVSTRGHETVMVVEDEAALRGLVERVLDGAGYTTLAFGSADEALGALGQGDRSIDLLLTDVMLPGALQGHDLARAVLASRPGLPVLYMSGYARDALVHAGRLDEGVNLLEKPFTGEALARMVRTVLDQPRHLE
jgi:two-component system cell cycle sensor histidine kinase/response regulator CckA